MLDEKENIWNGFESRLGRINPDNRHCLPDFLVISPPRTASTWLATNLDCHPDVFVPEKKEIHYFNNFWRTMDINWYLQHFKNTQKLKKGEATPSYSILPLQMIWFIKSIAPNMKIVFIMREPVERAWSEIKHNHAEGLGYFGLLRDRKFIDIPEEYLVEGLTLNNFILAHSDYMGCINRWLSVFSRDQIYIGFYENMVKNPRKMLGEVFAFLGVTEEVNWQGFRSHEKINVGLEARIPSQLKAFLVSIFREKSDNLSHFLNARFQASVPLEWESMLNANPALTRFTDKYKSEWVEIFREGYSDEHLKFILNTCPLSYPDQATM